MTGSCRRSAASSGRRCPAGPAGSPACSGRRRRCRRTSRSASRSSRRASRACRRSMPNTICGGVCASPGQYSTPRVDGLPDGKLKHPRLFARRRIERDDAVVRRGEVHHAVDDQRGDFARRRSPNRRARGRGPARGRRRVAHGRRRRGPADVRRRTTRRLHVIHPRRPAAGRRWPA